MTFKLFIVENLVTNPLNDENISHFQKRFDVFGMEWVNLFVVVWLYLVLVDVLLAEPRILNMYYFLNINTVFKRLFCFLY